MPELISQGIYTYIRYSMYVGMGLLQSGLGLLFGSVPPTVLVPITWWIIYLIAIRQEEAYLLGKFSDPYEAYLGQVRRWL